MHRRKWSVLFTMLVAWVGGASAITPSPYWKHEVSFPEDPFRAEGGSFEPETPGFIKFTILLDEPEVVYFQDCQSYLFHYNFAAEVLDPFLEIHAPAYDLVTLHAEGQEAILGAVIFPPRSLAPPQEFGIQLVRLDPYTPDEIIALFNLVKAKVTGPAGLKAYYFPTFEQSATAETNRDYLAANGVEIGSSARWTQGNVIYSDGWALGRVTYVPGAQIDAAYADGTLLATDILLTDGVPAEIPIIAGILSLSPSTPNSHVAILANSYSVPFAYLVEEEIRALVQSLAGQRVALRAFGGVYGGANLRIIPAQDLDESLAEQILALKAPSTLDIAPIAPFGTWSAPVTPRVPGDIQYFGGKATNMAILRTSIPDNSPVSMALSFDLWNDFLAQNIEGGGTVREAIDQRLGSYSYPPASIAALKADLAAVRDLFRDSSLTSFSEAARGGVLEALQDPQYGFDPERNLRFRSSTNVEDSGQFTGAGLYDSYSGCLADELDGDEDGPCRCEADEDDERGVFRAIRRVFASFYNDNAFLERLRHDLNEDEVGMAILVHHSFPDDEEKANGVATLTRDADDARIRMVTQLGAVSVSNPEGGALPEEVEVQIYLGETYASFLKPSSLVPLGANVMDWEEDYLGFASLMMAAADRFAEVHDKAEFVLDFEYKKNAPDGKLIVKQVREVPRPDSTPSVVPFLLGGTQSFVTFQGESGDVFANHRLKTRLQVNAGGLKLSAENLAQTVYGDVEMEYAADGKVHRMVGPLGRYPDFEHRHEEGINRDLWRFGALSNPRSYELDTYFPPLVSSAESPLFTLADASDGLIPLAAFYERPELSLNWAGEPYTRRSDTVHLTVSGPPQEGDLLQERVCEGTGGVVITTSFYWPPPPRGVSAGYTAPLVRWVETRIEGYTEEPVV